MMIPIKVWPFKCIDNLYFMFICQGNPNPFQFHYLGSLIFQALWQSLALSCLYQKDARLGNIVLKVEPYRFCSGYCCDSMHAGFGKVLGICLLKIGLACWMWPQTWSLEVCLSSKWKNAVVYCKIFGRNLLTFYCSLFLRKSDLIFFSFYLYNYFSLN